MLLELHSNVYICYYENPNCSLCNNSMENLMNIKLHNLWDFPLILKMGLVFYVLYLIRNCSWSATKMYYRLGHLWYIYLIIIEKGAWQRAECTQRNLCNITYVMTHVLQWSGENNQTMIWENVIDHQWVHI